MEFKRKVVTELRLSGWLSVKVYNANSFQVNILLTGYKSLVDVLFQDVTEELLERETGTNVTVNNFPFIKFDSSVLVVNRQGCRNVLAYS